MDLSISRNRRTHVQHRAGRFLRRAATYIILSTPLCGRASWTKNYVAHHGKRKVKRSVRTAASYFSFLRPRKRSKRRITLIERKTSSTSTDFSIVVPLLAPSLFLFLSLFSPVQSARSSRRDSIIAALSRLYSTRPHSIVKRESPNDPRRIMRFIILMWQPAKQDFNDTRAVNSGSLAG